MTDYSRQEAAERSGVEVDEIGRMVDAGLLAPADGDRLSLGDLRRIAMIQSFLAVGIPLDGLAAANRQGDLSLAFLDSPAFDRYGTLQRPHLRRAGRADGRAGRAPARDPRSDGFGACDPR